MWLRHRDPLPDDPVLHICALAYMSDLTLLGSAQVNHLDVRDQLQVASLDHAMWFMRPFRADEWLLYDQSSPSASGGRALTRGEIFTRSGRWSRRSCRRADPPPARSPVGGAVSGL